MYKIALQFLFLCSCHVLLTVIVLIAVSGRLYRWSSFHVFFCYIFWFSTYISFHMPMVLPYTFIFIHICILFLSGKHFSNHSQIFRIFLFGALYCCSIYASSHSILLEPFWGNQYKIFMAFERFTFLFHPPLFFWEGNSLSRSLLIFWFLC